MLRKLSGCFVLFVASIAAAHASDAYRLNLSVTRHGLLVGKPSVEVVANREADLVMTPPGGSREDAVRVLVSVAPAAEQDAIDIHMTVFDRTRGGWALRAKPSLKARFNKDVSVTIGNVVATHEARPIELLIKIAQPIAAKMVAGQLPQEISIPGLALAGHDPHRRNTYR